jgi:DNA polymerase-3 subunit beta
VKARIEKDTLIEALKVIGGAVAKRGVLEATRFVLLEATAPDTIRLSATDLEHHASCEAAAQVEEAGDVLVPFSLFLDVVSTFPDGGLDLLALYAGPRGKFTEAGLAALPTEAERKDARLGGLGGRWCGSDFEIVQGDRSASLKAHDPTNFPLSPDMADAQTRGCVDPGVLTAMIRRSAYAAATSESRPILTGVVFRAVAAQEKGEAGTISLGAADGFRLGLTQGDLADLAINAVCIIPAGVLSDVQKQLAHEEHPVEIVINDNQATFLLAGGAGRNQDRIFNIQHSVQLIEGTPINLKQIIPPTCACWITFDRAALEAALRSAHVIARMGAGSQVKVIVGSAGVTVYAHEIEVGETEIPVPGEVENDLDPEDGAFSINVAFVLEALQAVDTDTIRLGYNGPGKPVLFTLAERDLYQAMVMPMVARS